MLPYAKRDTSAAFKATLAADADTQNVLAEYRGRLQDWLRPILRKARTGSNPNPKMTYALWVSQPVDSPAPASAGHGTPQAPTALTGLAVLTASASPGSPREWPRGQGALPPTRSRRPIGPSRPGSLPCSTELAPSPP